MGRPDPVAARSLRQWPLMIVIVGVAIGLGVALIGEDTWRLGCLIIGSSLGVGAVERLALPTKEAGLLQVRGRVFDIAVMALAGASIIALAIVVPDGR